MPLVRAADLFLSGNSEECARLAETKFRLDACRGFSPIRHCPYEADSVNVGLPREIMVSGKTVRTSIWKYPVQGHVHVSTLNLDGDQQSDLSVHGGVDKAVYIYPSEHYSYWRNQLPNVELPWGAFGENF